MAADIIRFERANASTNATADREMSRTRDFLRAEPFPETPRQRAGRRRNPLRQDAERVSLAVTISGKLAAGRTDQLEGWGDYVKMLRRGADAARFLADELDRVAREAGPPPVA